MAKEILTNTKLFAQVVLNVIGSLLKNRSNELLDALQDILNLLNYNVSKIPPQGVELRLENGKVNLVPRQ